MINRITLSKLYSYVNGWVLSMALIVVANLLLIASAKIQIPFYPVPVTLQSFVVIGIALAIGWKRGSISVFLYLMEGFMGLPVFAGTPEKGIGLAYMLGPTGGYLIGFLVAVLVCGKIAELNGDKTIVKSFLLFIVGHGLIYIFGLLWLGQVIGWDKPILELGFYPFLVGTILKSIAGSVFPLYRFRRFLMGLMRGH